MDTALENRPETGAVTAPEQRIELGLEGMTCAACAARIEKVLNRIPGVEATVNFATETATAHVDTSRTKNEDLLAAVDRAGYHASIRRDPERDRREDQARKAAAYAAMKSEFVIAAILTV